MISRRQSAPCGGGGTVSRVSIEIPEHVVAQRRVLITGAGGSIGSALAHVVAARRPKQLLLMDASEQALYRIDRKVATPHISVLADVCDEAAIKESFEHHRPQIVFHAAAFKHVPLMEMHPFAAMRNNAIGTYRLARAAVRRGAEQVVIVSTDKAVEPASIMGASKRVAELLALALVSHATKIKAVRLGNVYGSQGSVVPLFEEQIARGEPVTVTHPESTRYFVSVDEATALLMSALAEELPSGILVPELAGPVRIEEIAKGLMRESASRSEIAYTGLRAGEKLHEKLLAEDEELEGDSVGPLRAIRSKRISGEEAAQAVGELEEAIERRNLQRLLGVVRRLVPMYEPGKTLLAGRDKAGCRA